MKEFKVNKVGDMAELKERMAKLEAIEAIEIRVAKKFKDLRNIENVGFFDVTDVPNHNQIEANSKKLLGDFNLILNHKLPMAKKIEQFAIDPVSFYLYKQRNFV